MATGFIRLLVGLAAWFVILPAGAVDVALVGVIGDKAAVLAVDGGEPKTVKVGNTWNGITVVSVEGDRATVLVDGRRRILRQGQHYRSAASLAAASARQSVTLAADAAGHFSAEGAVNGVPMRFMVDTGASAIALPGADAERARLDYRKARPMLTQTANGPVQVYPVRLDRVRVGDIELLGVDAIVIERGLPFPLLGMTFLNRVDMRREGQTMTLVRRF